MNCEPFNEQLVVNHFSNIATQNPYNLVMCLASKELSKDIQGKYDSQYESFAEDNSDENTKVTIKDFCDFQLKCFLQELYKDFEKTKEDYKKEHSGELWW